MKMKAWYVIADWTQDDEGDYCTFVWAGTRAAAERRCIDEMNDEQDWKEWGERVEYFVTDVGTLDEWIEMRKREIQNAIDFVAKGPA